MHISEISNQTFLITSAVCCTLLVIAVYTTIFLLCKRSQFKLLAPLVKASIIAYALYSPYNSALTIYTAVDKSSVAFYFSQDGSTLFTIAQTGFLVLHWTFTSHYLQTACLFSFTYAEYSYVQEKRLKLRKLILLAVNVSMYVTRI